MLDWLNREELLIGKANTEKLLNSTVAIFGCGGVGSYAIEGLARAGIGNFILIDKDIVDITNINRQLIADITTIGQDKVEIEKRRILNINPNAKVEIHKIFCNKQNVNELVKDNYDYIVDAIDSVDSKLSLIKTAHDKNINIISAMGMGNKLSPTMIEVSDISKTEVCPLSRIIRKKLKEEGIYHTKVVYSKEKPIREDVNEANKKITASISFVPSVCGLVMASEIVKDIIK